MRAAAARIKGATFESILMCTIFESPLAPMLGWPHFISAPNSQGAGEVGRGTYNHISPQTK